MDMLGTRQQRIVYLLTYSRVDITKMPSKKHFADAVLNGWEKSDIEISHWVVALEKHKNPGSPESLESSGNHFHMAIKLKKRGRLLSVRNFLAEAYGIQVNFSANHNTYYSAYKYVTKEDAEPLLSSDHPDISNELPVPRRQFQLRGRTPVRERKQKKEEMESRG